VVDELAFPLLLHGLTQTNEWTDLRIEELPGEELLESNDISDNNNSNKSKNGDYLLSLFFNLAFADGCMAALLCLENAHYLHPLGGFSATSPVKTFIGKNIYNII